MFFSAAVTSIKESITKEKVLKLLSLIIFILFMLIPIYLTYLRLKRLDKIGKYMQKKLNITDKDFKKMTMGFKIEEKN